jgi:hypothetical protein
LCPRKPLNFGENYQQRIAATGMKKLSRRKRDTLLKKRYTQDR